MANKIVRKFDENKVVRVTQELYDLDRVRWKLSIGGYRLLFALAQCLDYTDDLFPEIVFDKKTVFRYLGLENNKDCYNQLSKTLHEIQSSPLEIMEIKKNGSITWAGFSWITSYLFNSHNPQLCIKINTDIKPFLLNLKQYAAIQPKYYLRLSTEYQNWFYPYLKNVVKLGKWQVSIEKLKRALYLENTPSYDPKQNKNATENFLKYVLGIQISKTAKEEQQKAKKENCKPKLISWDYTKDKSGQPTGTLAGITINTDINVSACAVKTGRAYTDIIFFLSEKPKSLSKKYKEKLIEKNNANVDQDMGHRKEDPSMADLFSTGGINPDYIAMNPFFEKELPKPKAKAQQRHYYEHEIIRSFAESINKTFEEAISNLKLKQDKEGRYYKEV